MKINNTDYSDENKEIGNKGSNILKSITATALVVIILLNSKKIVDNLINNEDKTSYEPTSTTSTIIEDNIEENSNLIDYTYAEEFYNKLLSYKQVYGSDFASALNTLDDVKSLYTFIVKFDDIYYYDDNTTNIKSIEDYENILNSYFESCIKYDVEPFISTMFYNKDYYYKLLSEAEGLVYNLKNSLGSDYTIANRYFSWLGVNLWDGSTAIKINKINAPYIYMLMIQYTNYKNCGNMKLAIRYEKNNTLDINGKNDFSCPAGVDQFIRGYKVYNEYGQLIDSNDFHETLIELLNSQCENYKQLSLIRAN